MISKEKMKKLWEFIDQGDYKNSLAIVQDYPEDTINAIHPEDNLSLFTVVAGYGEKGVHQKKLVDYIVITNKKQFKLNNESDNCDETNVESIVGGVLLDVIEFFKNDSRLVFSGEKLTYELIKERLNSSETSHGNDLESNESKKLLQSNINRINDLKKMKEIVHTLTKNVIKQAVNNEDEELIDRVHKASLKAGTMEWSNLIRGEYNRQIEEENKRYNKEQNELGEEHYQKKVETVEKVIEIVKKPNHSPNKTKITGNLFGFLFSLSKDEDELSISNVKSKKSEETNKKKPGLFNKNTKDVIENKNTNKENKSLEIF